MKVAVFSTSSALLSTWDQSTGKLITKDPSTKFLEKIREGYDVYVISTRKKLHTTFDAWIFRLVKENRIFTPDPDSDVGHAQASGLIDVYTQLIHHLNDEYALDIKIPTHLKYMSWMDVRDSIRESAVELYP